MATKEAVASTLAELAIMVGLPQVAKWLKGIIERKAGLLTDAEVNATVGKIASAASAKSGAIMEQINERLSKFNLPYGASSILKAYLNKARSKYKAKADKVRDYVNSINEDISAQSSRLSDWTQKSVIDKWFPRGKSEGLAIKSDLEDSIKKLNEVEVPM